jgi:hypothetical protein
MAKARDMIHNSLSRNKPYMREQGYSAKGNVFHRTTADGNSCLIQVQTSVKSLPSLALFTINYGAYSSRIGRFFGDDESAARDVTRAHWRTRIRDGRRDTWIQVASDAALDAIADELLARLKSIQVDLEKHCSDDVLRDEWMSGRSPGLTDLERLLYLSVLLKEIGPISELPNVASTLKSRFGESHAGLLQRHFTTLGIIE